MRPRDNPSRYKIKTSGGEYYDFQGTPKVGDHLRRLGPVIFRLSPLGHRVVEVEEITNPVDAAMVPPLMGRLTDIDRSRGIAWVAALRMDGTYDQNSFKFHLSNLEDPNGPLPKKGSRVLFRTDYARSNHLDKQGKPIHLSRFINVVHITNDTNALRTHDACIINPELLKTLRTELKITLEVGTEPVHRTFRTLTALQALELENQSLPHTLSHMHDAIINHCNQNKHIKEPTASSSSTDTDPFTPQEHALLKQARELRHTINSKHTPYNILINPQAWQEHKTAREWVRHINHTLSTNSAFAGRIGKIFLLEHAGIDTNTDTIITSNVQILTRPIHSTLPNHVHRIHYVDTPTHEGEWNEDEIEHARACNFHKYIIHEFRSEEFTTFIPNINTITTTGMDEFVSDDASQVTMGPAPNSQITVFYPTSDKQRTTAIQQVLAEYDDFPHQQVDLFSSFPNWKKIAIDAPVQLHPRILTSLNAHLAGITAMREADFQGANDGILTHITLFTRPSRAGHTTSLGIKNLLASHSENDLAPTPAHSYLSSPHSITITTPLTADDVETRLCLYKSELGETEFPFVAFFVRHSDSSKNELRWVVKPPEKLAPCSATQTTTRVLTPTRMENCILEINGATTSTLVTPANTKTLQEIFTHFSIGQEAAQAATWVRSHPGHYAIKVYASLAILNSRGPMTNKNLAVSPRSFNKEEYPTTAYKVLRKPNTAPHKALPPQEYIPVSKDISLFTMIEKVRALHLGKEAQGADPASPAPTPDTSTPTTTTTTTTTATTTPSSPIITPLPIPPKPPPNSIPSTLPPPTTISSTPTTSSMQDIEHYPALPSSPTQSTKPKTTPPKSNKPKPTRSNPDPKLGGPDQPPQKRNKN